MKKEKSGKVTVKPDLVPPAPTRSTPSAAHAKGSGFINLGVIVIPIKFYTAIDDKAPQFNLVHGVCNSRIKQQLYCPKCEETVERDTLVSGYQDGEVYRVFNRESMVYSITGGEKNENIDVLEFTKTTLPHTAFSGNVDYLGTEVRQPVEPYRLLHAVMTQTKTKAIVRYSTNRGVTKYAVLIPEAGEHKIFSLHTLRYNGEVRSGAAIPRPQEAPINPTYVAMATQLVESMCSDTPTLFYENTDLDKALAFIKKNSEVVENTATTPPKLKVVGGRDLQSDFAAQLQESLKQVKKKK